MLHQMHRLCREALWGRGPPSPVTLGLITLRDWLPLSGRSYATHGVSDAPARAGGVPRFYKHVTVTEALDQEGFQIMLDQRVLKTPAKQPLILPNRSLALAIAAEWEWQASRIDTSTMPLMSLAATALDQPQPRSVVIQSMVQYLQTDPVVCRDEPGKLADTQAEVLNPLLEWVRQHTGAQLPPTDSIFGADLPEEEVQKVGKYLQGLDHWHLTAAEHLAASCKSVIIGMATAAGRLGVQEALRAARLEEDQQIAEWGLVEGGHDVDIADLRMRVAAPAVFIRLIGHNP